MIDRNRLSHHILMRQSNLLFIHVQWIVWTILVADQIRAIFCATIRFMKPLKGHYISLLPKEKQTNPKWHHTKHPLLLYQSQRNPFVMEVKELYRKKIMEILTALFADVDSKSTKGEIWF